MTRDGKLSPLGNSRRVTYASDGERCTALPVQVVSGDTSGQINAEWNACLVVALDRTPRNWFHVTVTIDGKRVGQSRAMSLGHARSVRALVRAVWRIASRDGGLHKRPK